jgi:AcrR family transcriptional regulator
MQTEETDKKREIRHTAVELFKQNGYDNVTLNDICRACHISKNTFYYYFTGKDDLIRQLLKPPVQLNSTVLMRIMAIEDPYDQLIELYTLSVRHFASMGPEIARKLLAENLTRPFVDDRRKCKGAPSEYFQLIRGIYEKAMKQGEIRDDVSVRDLIHGAMILLMGCLQIWATVDDPSFDLEKTYLRNYKLLIRK